MISQSGGATQEDVRGSISSYHPYGEQRASPPGASDAAKFATYTRDSVSGLDYAGQRYYLDGAGRFGSPDSYRQSAGAELPQSWNRYTYVLADPIGYLDPNGTTVCTSLGAAIVCHDSVDVAAQFYFGSLGGLITSGSGSGPGLLLDGGDGGSGGINAQIQAMLDGLASAMSHLSSIDCQRFFSGAAVSLSAFGVSNPVQALALYWQQGWITAGSTYTRGGQQFSFGSTDSPAGDWNIRGVTIAGQAAYVNSSGTRISVYTIQLNLNSWAFSGYGMSSGVITPIQQMQPSAFGGLGQADVLALAVIHELGHALGVLPDDAGNPAQSMTNSNDIRKACFQ